jgi:hypothetical protein
MDVIECSKSILNVFQILNERSGIFLNIRQTFLGFSERLLHGKLNHRVQ